MASFGAIGGGGLSGAGTGAALGTVLGATTGIGAGVGVGAAAGSVVPGIGTAIGAGAGLLYGALSGLFSSNSEERKATQQMLMRAADQRAAPWLAKLGVKTEVTPYKFADDHSTDLLQGAANGAAQYQNAQNASSQNQIRDLMKQKLMGNDPAVANKQIEALQGMSAMPSAPQDLGLNEAMFEKMQAMRGVS